MKTILVYSGGLDSTTLLYKLRAESDRVFALSFDYGQRHKKELRAAAKICKKLGVPHRIVSLASAALLFAGSALTSRKIAVPEGHYKDRTMRATVVPNRNMVFLALAIAAAVSQKADRVALAVHAGDHAIYPDCRPAFIRAMRAAARAAHYEKIDVYAPFLHIPKAKIVKIGRRLGVPFQATWTCYKGLAKPCGKCGACRERQEALAS